MVQQRAITIWTARLQMVLCVRVVRAVTSECRFRNRDESRKEQHAFSESKVNVAQR